MFGLHQVIRKLLVRETATGFLGERIVMVALVAFLALGTLLSQSVPVAYAQVTATPSASPDDITFGPTLHAASCMQPPSQAVKDHASLSNAELDTYGLPHHVQGKPLAEWQDVVRHAAHRECDLTPVFWHGQGV